MENPYQMAVAAEADWILDLGPEAGGEIVAERPPELVAKSKKSRTAPFLAPAMSGTRPT